MVNKNDIRQVYLSSRNNLSLNEKKIKSATICKSIITSEIYKNASSIFTYVNIGFEVETSPVIEDAFNNGKKIYVPKITPSTREMKFYELKNYNNLAKNKFGLLEPVLCENEVTPNKTAIFLVPGLVFDYNKNRIGYGKGYYDYYFSKHNCFNKIGLAYDIQLIEKIINEQHDVQLDCIVTESKWIE